MTTYYSYKEVNELINKYLDRGGDFEELEEGLYTYGLAMLHAHPDLKLKTFIIQEVVLNEWSTAFTIRGYNKTPKKYEKMLERVIEAQEE